MAGVQGFFRVDQIRVKHYAVARLGGNPHPEHRIPYKPGGCIVGEPTGMNLVVAHKGKRSYRCRVRGFEAHSALNW